MSKITRMGIDLGKNTFHVCAMDRAGRVVLEKPLHRPDTSVQLNLLARTTSPLQLRGGPYKRGLPARGRPKSRRGPRMPAIPGMRWSQPELCT